jgi:hypothetical protein
VQKFLNLCLEIDLLLSTFLNLKKLRFIDFGNVDEATFADMGIIPSDLGIYERQAIQCSLAYI